MTVSETEIFGILEAIWRFDLKPLPPKEAEIMVKWEAGQVPHRCVYAAGPSWVVRLYFAGKQRTFGTFPDATNACRIADIAIHRLYRFRTKHKAALTEMDFNLSQENAKRDLDQHPELLSLFVQLESLVPEPSEVQTRKRRTYETSRQMFADIRQEIKDLRAEICQLVKH